MAGLLQIRENRLAVFDRGVPANSGEFVPGMDRKMRVFRKNTVPYRSRLARVVHRQFGCELDRFWRFGVSIQGETFSGGCAVRILSK